MVQHFLALPVFFAADIVNEAPDDPDVLFNVHHVAPEVAVQLPVFVVVTVNALDIAAYVPPTSCPDDNVVPELFLTVIDETPEL